MVSTISLNEIDDFRLVEGDYSLAGIRSGRKFKMGDKVWIKVVAANLDKRQLDYMWVNKPDIETIETSITNKPIIKMVKTKISK